MTLFLAALTTLAFAGLYALLLAMLGSRTGDLRAALLGSRAQPAGGAPWAASRRLIRA